jgi:hypothetical protein
MLRMWRFLACPWLFVSKQGLTSVMRNRLPTLLGLNSSLCVFPQIMCPFLLEVCICQFSQDVPCDQNLSQSFFIIKYLSIATTATRFLSSYQSSAKYEDTTKLKLKTWLVWWIKPLPRFNQNELDWYENFINTAYSVSKNDWLFPDCTFLSEIQLIWAVIT